MPNATTSQVSQSVISRSRPGPTHPLIVYSRALAPEASQYLTNDWPIVTDSSGVTSLS